MVRCNFPVILKYALSPGEYIESQQAYRLRMAGDRVFFRNLYLLACLVAVLGLYVRLSGSSWWGDVLFLVAGVLALERT